MWDKPQFSHLTETPFTSQYNMNYSSNQLRGSYFLHNGPSHHEKARFKELENKVFLDLMAESEQKLSEEEKYKGKIETKSLNFLNF